MYNPFYIFYTADHYCENIRSPSTLGGVGRSVFKKNLDTCKLMSYLSPYSILFIDRIRKG